MSDGLFRAEGMGRMVRMFGRMAILPLSTFAAGTDALAQLAKGIQQAASEGLDKVSEGFPLAGTLGSSRREGESLADDQVKLVDCSIVSTSQDLEEVLHQEQLVLVDNLSEEAFSAWRVADFLEGPGASLSDEEKSGLRVYLKVLDRWSPEDGA